MRVVLDTNVLVSAMLTPGGPAHQVLQLILRGDVTLCLDARISAEYHDVLTRGQFRFPRGDVEQLLTAVREDAQEILAAPVPGRFPDEDDRVFAEVAVAASAAALITGNTRHFRAAEALTIRVMTPAEFLRWWRRQPRA